MQRGFLIPVDAGIRNDIKVISMKIDIAQSLTNKKICILGFGREGISTYQYLLKHHALERITVADKLTQSELSPVARELVQAHPPGATFWGADYLSSLENVDLVILTPGIPAHLPEIIAAQKLGVIFTSQTDLFLQSFSARTIGITGTKGKSTTSSLITHILKTAGHAVELVGNIERPVFDFWDFDSPDKLYVYELSSHQLSGITVSPHIAVFLNFYPEHLDYYPSVEDYFTAKARITSLQKPEDVFIYNSASPALVKLGSSSPAHKLAFSPTDKLPPDWMTSLLGQHNVTNISAATLALREIGLSDLEIKNGLASFQSLKYRLESIGIYRGIEFYDDALATLPEAAIAALDALMPRVTTLIAGGHERNQDFTNFARKIIEVRIKTLILFPPTGERIEAEIKKLQPINMLTCYHVNTMAEAVKLGYLHTKAGEICLLSAGAPSFGIFKDYKDRSDQYREGVKRFESHIK